MQRLDPIKAVRQSKRLSAHGRSLLCWMLARRMILLRSKHFFQKSPLKTSSIEVTFKAKGNLREDRCQKAHREVPVSLIMKLAFSPIIFNSVDLIPLDL